MAIETFNSGLLSPQQILRRHTLLRARGQMSRLPHHLFTLLDKSIPVAVRTTRHVRPDNGITTRAHFVAERGGDDAKGAPRPVMDRQHTQQTRTSWHNLLLRQAQIILPNHSRPLSWCLLLRTKEMAITDTTEVAALRLHEKDTGSADVQIALLTKRINDLTEHLKSHRKDHSSRRGLLKLVAQRRSLLDYLKKNSAERYQNVLQSLNLRK
jgi:small subunit ribosomal protein S15